MKSWASVGNVFVFFGVGRSRNVALGGLFVFVLGFLGEVVVSFVFVFLLKAVLVLRS